jgi:hypothetical protein
MNNLRLFGRDITPELLRQVVTVLFLALFAYNVYGSSWPSVEAYLAKRGEIEQQQQQIDAARTLIGTREQIESRLATVRTSLAAIQDRFPLRNQILSILLVDLSEMFKDAGTDLINFEPLGFKPLEQGGLRNLGSMQIKIAARGDYPSTILLFDKLARYERVLRLESPQIAPSAAGGGAAGGVAPAGGPVSAFNRNLDVAFTLTTYALNR